MAANGKATTQKKRTTVKRTTRTPKVEQKPDNATTQTRSANAAKKESSKAVDNAVTYVKVTTERAVDIPVGVALTVRENVEEAAKNVEGAVKPFTSRTTAEK